MVKQKQKAARTKKLSPTKAVAQAEEVSIVHQENVPQSQLPVVQNTPDMLIAMGIEKGVSIEQLEKLMDLQDRWLAREAKSKFLQAKSDFQSEVPTLGKTRNVHYEAKDGKSAVNYYFAPLGTIAHVLKPLLKKFGLTYDWKLDDKVVDEKGLPMIEVTFVLSHVAGHSEMTSMKGYLDTSGNKTGMHSRSSTVSYLQRYTLIAGMGLSTDDVDDDAAKSQNPKAPAQANVRKQTLTDAGFQKLLDRANAGEKVLEKSLEHLDLTPTQIDALEIIEKNHAVPVTE